MSEPHDPPLPDDGAPLPEPTEAPAVDPDTDLDASPAEAAERIRAAFGL